LIAALDHKPMDRILTDDPANLALKFPKTRHAITRLPEKVRISQSGSMSVIGILRQQSDSFWSADH
jgi:hypothetical protein